MALQSVIGIDGGGTKTHLLCTTLQGEVLCEVFGGSSNLCSNSEKQVEENLTELIQKCMQEVGGEMEVVSLCLGTAGLSCLNAKETLTKILKNATNCSKISILGDMVIPLVAEIQDKPGLIMISGTGAISYGRNASSTYYRSSGWGHLVGDEGSAYWIAVEGVKAALRGFDGRGKETKLHAMLLEELNCKDNSELVQRIYAKGHGKKEMAALSQVVNKAAIHGDQVAEGILRGAAKELFVTAESVINELQLDQQNEFHVVLCGGVLLKNTYVNNQFKQLVQEKYKNSRLVEAQRDPVWGAVTTALRGM